MAPPEMVTVNCNGDTKKISIAKLSANGLSQTFKLDKTTITLMDDDGVEYKQANGKFIGLEKDKEYEVYGDAMKAVVPKVQFTGAELMQFQDEVTHQTQDMQARLNGGSLAHQAVSMIYALTVLTACTPDPSLVNEKTKGMFNKLTTPQSFKASLVQVISAATRAFMHADNATTTISQNLTRVPGLMVQSIEVAGDPSDTASPSILETNKELINEIADRCANEAKSVAEAYTAVTELIDEILQAATATQGVNEEAVKELKKLKDEWQTQKEFLEKEEAYNKEELEKQAEITKETMAKYNEQADRMGSLGSIFVAHLLDSVANVSKAVIDTSKASLTAVGEAAKNIATVMPQKFIGRDVHKHDSSVSKAHEKSLAQFVESYCIEGLPSSSDIMSKAPDHKACLVAFTSFRATSVTGKILLEKVKEYIEILDNLYKDGAYERLNGCFNVMASFAAGHLKELEIERRHANDNMRATAGIMEQLNNSAAQAHASYSEERQREDVLKSKAREFRRELSELGNKLKKGEADTVNLDEVVVYLAKGLNMLASLRQAWLAQEQFFNAVKNTVSGPIKDTLHLFLKQQDMAVDSPGSVRLRKILLGTAMQACGVGWKVISCMDIYQEVSQKYVIPPLGDITKNLQLSKTEAKAKLASIEFTFDKTQSEVLQLIEKRKKEMLGDAGKKILEYTEKLAITDK